MDYSLPVFNVVSVAMPTGATYKQVYPFASFYDKGNWVFLFMKEKCFKWIKFEKYGGKWSKVFLKGG